MVSPERKAGGAILPALFYHSYLEVLTISVVIPTCNRKQRLLKLLDNLCGSVYPLEEVIIVDSGEDRLQPAELSLYPQLDIQYLQSEKSVCIQRNKGVQQTRSQWVFLCDDDIEVPADYLQLLAGHAAQHPEAGAISGLVLQQEAGQWVAAYPLTSARSLLFKYIFQQSIWGPLQCADTWMTRPIKAAYQKKANHIARSGWPVVTEFSGGYFITPVYGLGASLVLREWLLASPYDEVLDPHGIGDNYGVAAGFPGPVHVCNNAHVFHHQAAENRISEVQQYYRRVLALDYFRSSKKGFAGVQKTALLWSLTGQLWGWVRAADFLMIKATLKAIALVALKRNPYAIGAARGKKRVTPKPR
ncbi:glycosyltransferase family 2 protein [Foetidibacter luteolus]|uniref:glycosyltransferase family 2 protein n=1 Tax=Foetidibacter luteolus TaxID=2608880 RepID=UPI001A99F2A3|nr:glycosyltransferase family 2 protein [Foetidibacter luteolus]